MKKIVSEEEMNEQEMNEDEFKEEKLNEDEFNEDELMVSQILLELSTIFTSNFLCLNHAKFAVTWGSTGPRNSKRRRRSYTSQLNPSASMPTQDAKEMENVRDRALKEKDTNFTLKDKQKELSVRDEDQSQGFKISPPSFTQVEEAVLRTYAAVATAHQKAMEQEMEDVRECVVEQRDTDSILKDQQNMEVQSCSVGQVEEKLPNSTAEATTPQQPATVDQKGSGRSQSPTGPLEQPNVFTVVDLNVCPVILPSGVVDGQLPGQQNLVNDQPSATVEMQKQQEQQQQLIIMNQKAFAATQARQRRLQIQRLKKHSASAANKRPPL